MQKFGYPLYRYPKQPSEIVPGFQLIGPYPTAEELVAHVRENIKAYTGDQAPAGVMVFDAEMVSLFPSVKLPA